MKRHGKLLSGVLWTVWALVPVAVLAYHFGPGQRAYMEQQAEGVLREAGRLTEAADEAQGAAYVTQLASLDARRQALKEKTPETAAAARQRAAEEDAAYKAAGAAWGEVANKLRAAQDMLTACGSEKVDAVRISRGRATIRSGEIAAGVDDLEAMLDSLDEEKDADTARQVREEIATGYYYGARIMRMGGKPTTEWRAVSGVARQNFRYLAESAPGEDAGDLQKNLELVLNLEQSGQEDLLAKPLPKNCPSGTCNNIKPGKKVSKKPPRNKQDARGAGGADDIPGGW